MKTLKDFALLVALAPGSALAAAQISSVQCWDPDQPIKPMYIVTFSSGAAPGIPPRVGVEIKKYINQRLVAQVVRSKPQKYTADISIGRFLIEVPGNPQGVNTDGILTSYACRDLTGRVH